MLAVLGGKPVLPSANQSHGRYPVVGDRERAWLDRALTAQRLWGPWGEITRELEMSWAHRVGVPFCAALNSGTAALHCAVLGVGIKPGDEVIVPAYTFIGTTTGVLLAGAVPIFADVENDTGNISAETVKKKLSERTRAIIVVHLHGLPADVPAIRQLVSGSGIAVIEDCAQAHGASLNGVQVGGLADVGAFSLNATMLLAGPEGGLLTTHDQDIYNRAARTRVFGIEHHEGRAIVRNADGIGLSYRTNEIMSAFALARLEAFDQEQSQRRRNAQLLANGLSTLAGLQVPREPAGATHVYQLFRVRLDPVKAGCNMSPKHFRERVMAALAGEGARWWTWETRSLPEYSLFQTKNAAQGGLPWIATANGKAVRYSPEDTPIAAATARDTLFTNSHFPPNDEALMDGYVSAFRKVWSHLDQLAQVPVGPTTNDELVDFT